MATLFYAESRLLNVDRREFLARWRAHGGYALGFASFRSALTRYVHHDPVHDAMTFPGSAVEYDALGEIACRDLSTLRTLLSSPDLRGPIRTDGARTFARTRTLEAVVEERVLAGRPSPISVAAFAAGASAPAVLADALAEIQLTLTGRGPLRHLVRRVAVSPAVDDRARWGVFLELGFDDLSTAGRGYADWLPMFTADAVELLTDVRVIVSVRCPLYDPAVLGAKGLVRTSNPKQPSVW